MEIQEQGVELKYSVPLTEAQKQLWLLSQIDSKASVAYNVSYAIELHGILHSGLLRKALQMVVNRHQLLRASISRDGEVLNIAENLEIGFDYEDVSDLSEAEQQEWFREETSREFDLTAMPLFRLTLFRCGPDEHILYLVSHHTVVDGASMYTVFRELGEVYSGLCENREFQLPDLPRYEECLKRQQNRGSNSREWLEAEEYWLHQFRSNVPTVDLPTYHLRPGAKTYNGAAASMLIPPDLAEDLKAISSEHNCTLFMTLFAGFAALVHRLSGQDDLVLGINISGRSQKVEQYLVGYFTRVLPIRIAVADSVSFVELLDHTRELLLEALQHREYTLGDLVQKLNPPRIPGRSPLVDITFNFDRDAERFQFTGLDAHLVPVPLAASKYDMDFNVIETRRGLRCDVEYNTDVFRPEMVRHFLELWKNLLGSLVTRPHSRLLELPWVGDEERALLADWNRTETEYPQQSYIGMFELHARLTPEARAVAYEGLELSYRELNERANRLGRYLSISGVVRETRVGVFLERGLDWVAAILAIWKSGGVYVPLDITYPKDRLAFMLTNGAIQVLVTDGTVQEELPLAAAKNVFVDRDWDLIAQQSGEDLNIRSEPGDLAYVIHTSGSTGQPKGAMIEHRGMMNHLWAKVRDLGLTAGDIIVQNAPASFDVSIWQLFAAMLVGGTVQIINQEIARDASQLLREADRLGATVLETVPAMLGIMVQEQEERGGKHVLLDKLRWMISNAEPLSTRLCQQWTALYPKVQLLNAYGPTECSDDVSHLLVQSSSLRNMRYAPLGKRLQNTKLYVLDAAGEPVPIGVRGELYIGGICVGRGYQGKPELTAEKFVPDPFSGNPGARLYRTGDCVRFLPDGSCDFVGRVDYQVKLRGYRIELQEIEAMLNQHRHVICSAAVIREDEPGDRRLVAYVMKAAGAAMDNNSLRAFLHERLPHYMVPSVIVVLDRMPLTVNEKIDRNALPKPESLQRDSAREFVAPRNHIEKLVASIWEELLHVEKVGAYDSFFELGGHSLLATQVAARIRRALQVDLPLRRLFEAPTVGALARIVEEEQREGRADPPIEKVSRQKPLPLSYAQQRLWFLRQFETDAALYNMLTVLRINGELQVPVLEVAVGEIVRRHEILRTSFIEEHGVPVQIVTPPCSIHVPVMSLQGTEEERKRQLERIIDEQVQRPFDLARGPLLRLLLLQTSATEHICLLAMHHIAGDGWSMEVFLHELTVLYDAFLKGNPSPLAELPFQYADYGVWQRRCLEGNVLNKQLDYWKTQLKGIPHAIELPTVGARPATLSHRARQHTFKISQEVSASLQALSRAQGVTLYMTLLAAFKALLSQYSGQTDIVVGASVAGRKQTEDLIGFFVNALVLRTDLSGMPSFRQLLERVREVSLGAFAHADVPFEKLVEELQPQRDMSRTPLFQIMFDLQRPMRAHSNSLTLSEESFEFPLEKFDLSLRMIEASGCLEGIFLYQTDLFDQKIISRMAGNFMTLLAAIVASPDRPLDELDLLTFREKQLVAGWNETEREFPGESCVQAEFEKQAAQSPEALAVVQGTVRMSYCELNCRANQLARFLRSRGVGAEVRVGVCLERGVEMVIGLLGILKAGGAYVPLDPTYPAERLEYMVEDAGVGLILSEEAYRGRFWEMDAEVLCVEELREQAEQLSGENPGWRNSSQEMAYLMYTSGSTGQPKGIMVPHQAILRLVMNTDYVQLGSQDRMAQVSNASFDAATFEIWGALLNGSRLVVIDKDIVLSAVELGRTLKREQITAMFLTTALFNQGAREAERSYSGVKTMLFGGEAVDVRCVAAVKTGGGPERLLHVYGPTETTTFATWYEVGEVDAGGERIPIGGPIRNTRVYVLNQNLQPVPVGVPGEIYVGGPGVARGYWGKACLTAEKFVPDPFSRRGGERLYRTGDKARYRDEEGRIEFLGRVDEQVKVRGYRVELGGIEAMLRQQEGVKEAVVVLREEGGEKQLVGYVAGKAGRELSVSQVREGLKRTLPEYMVPAALVLMEELPLNANGKVDREALAPPEREDHDLQEYVEPETELEKELCRIWAEILQVPRVGTRDNFFELGGHSLLATRLISRIRSDFGAELSLRALFESSTVKRFAERIQEELGKGMAQRQPIVAVEERSNLPLSFAQSRLWFIHQLQPHSVAYNAPFHWQLIGEMDRPRLEGCLTEIVSRHEVLRTSFPARNGQPVQDIHPPYEIKAPLIDLSSLPKNARNEAARRLRQQDAEQIFDLAHGPLLRVTLLRLGPQEHQLLLAMHHIVTDGWSVSILFHEFAALWNASCQGRPSPLLEPTLQYADYAAWQQKWLHDEILSRELPYWRKQLEHVPVLDLPTDRARKPLTSHPGAELPISLGPQLSAAVAEWCQQEGVTLFMALLALFQWLLSRYSMQEDIAIGTVIANRNRKEVEGLMGFFVNTLVLRTDVSGAPTFRQLVQRVREVTTSAYMHQDLPFEKLVEELNPDRDLRRSPLFQVRFTLDTEPPPLPATHGLHIEEIYLELPEIKFDLTMAILSDSQGVLKGQLVYAADLFERASMERLLEHFRFLVARAVAEPDAQLTAIPLMEEEERQQTVVAWNSTGTGSATEKCVHHLFEERAALTPDQPALVYEGVRLSYVELDQKANQLAHLLRDFGTGPETRIGICMSRRAEMVIALLAVLKAGAAYVPIDPANPMDRIALFLESAQIPLLLTEERLRNQMPSSWTQLVFVDTDRSTIEAQSTGPVSSLVCPECMAYVIYTSGSTGAPKPVGIEHRQLANYINVVSEKMECKPGWKFALLSSMAADLGNTVLFASLCCGGELHVIGEERLLNGRKLGEYFQKERIDCTKITPSHLVGLNPTPDLMPKQLLVLGGEASAWSWGSKLMSLRPDCRIMNHYGPTECTIGATTCRLETVVSNAAEHIPLGSPLGNIRVYVLDRAMQPLATGMAGELYIGGKGVGRGYLNHPDVTAERFVPDFLSGHPGERLYRTGDRARWLENGMLEFLGRVDHQVKIRGFRVELDEIESVLKRHPEVGQAAVLLREDVPGQKRLVAYVSRRVELKHPPKLFYRLPNGRTIAHHNPEETEFLYQAIFEREHYLQCSMEMFDDACVFDVGANIGMFTLFASERCSHGRIFAFEPIPTLADTVIHNAQLCSADVKVFPYGIAEAEKTVEFVFYPECVQHSGMKAYAAPELENKLDIYTVECKVRRLSDVIKEEGVDFIDFLKVDVQRSELHVLDGIDQDDWAKIGQIFVFVIRHFTSELTEARVREVVRLLEGRGFTVSAIQDGQFKGGDWSIFAKNPAAMARRRATANARKPEGRELSPTVLAPKIRTFLKERLPEYMVPSSIVVLPTLPLTASGKIDRRSLKAPARAGDAESEFVPPRNELETQICEIWKDVLGEPRISINDDFFKLGGHSLLAAEVVLRIENTLGVEVPLATLFTASTVAQFVQELELIRAQEQEPAPELKPLNRVAFMQS